jgi:hypothetical protein
MPSKMHSRNPSNERGMAAKEKGSFSRSMKVHTAETRQTCGNEERLPPTSVEYIRQKTLYKMKQQLWTLYQQDWDTFKMSDHLTALAPIPPCCRTLTLHYFLRLTNSKIDQTSLTFVVNNHQALDQAFKQAKKQFQMSTNRILDKQLVLHMKKEIENSYLGLCPESQSQD